MAPSFTEEEILNKMRAWRHSFRISNENFEEVWKAARKSKVCLQDWFDTKAREHAIKKLEEERNDAYWEAYDAIHG